MKHLKTLLLMGLMGLCVQAWAQPSQGSMMIAGSAGFSSYKYGDYSASFLYLDPQVAYFITDQLAVGAGVTLNLFGGDDDGSRIGLGPFVRYYFNNAGEARFFGQAGFSFLNIDFGGNSDAFSNFGFNVGAGVDYFLNSNVALEAFLGFSSDKDQDDDESATRIGLNIGVAAFIGN